MPSDSVVQLAARLLPPALCAQIGAGMVPSVEIAYHLAVMICDCEALNNTEKSTWTERRLSKQMVALAALMMIGLAKEDRV